MATPSLQDKLKALLMSAGANQAAAQEMPQDFNIPQASSGGSVSQPPIDPVAEDPGYDSSLDSPAVPRPSLMNTSLSVMARGPARANPTKEIQDRLRAALEKTQGAQQDNIDLDKVNALGQLSKRQGIDFSPTYAFLRAASGNKNVGAGVEAPEDLSKNVDTARSTLSKDQKGLNDSIEAQLKTELSNKLLGQQYQNQRLNMQQDRLNEMIYGKQVTALRNDPTLNHIVEKNNSITRTADVLFAPGQDINTTSLHDLQQTVTGALTGLPGGGGVGERADRYMTDMNTDLAKLKQKFGDVNSIPMDEPILQHYMSLAQEGQAFLQDQAHRRIKTLAGGHENVTALPTYAPMFNQQIEDVKSNILSPKYNVKSAQGKGAGAQNANASQISNKDKAAIDWAKSNADDPRAAKILQMHGIK